MPSVTVTEEDTEVGSTWRYTAPAIGGTTVELTVVVEFFEKVEPTWVPVPLLHLLADQATAQTKTVKDGVPDAGLETVIL